jgi:hypothetical protein
MLLLERVSVALLITASLTVSASFSRAATYSYSGNPFTVFSASGGGSAAGLVGQSVSGEFTVATPLGSNFNGMVNPTQFSFFGGLLPITNYGATSYSFQLQTSDIGAVAGWTISIRESGPAGYVSIFTSNAGDSSSSLGPRTSIGASNSGMPGTWSWSSACGSCDHHDAPAPLIGASLPGLAIGFGVFWLIRRRAAGRMID